MKRKLVLFGLAAACCAYAAKKPAKKNTKKAKAVAEKIDTVSVDTFSYAMGQVNSQGLREYVIQRENVDTAYFDEFIEGLKQGTLTEKDKKLMAYVAGIKIRQQVDGQIIPQVNKQTTDNDTTKLINEDLFREGFCAAAANSKDARMSMSKAQTIVGKQMEYYQKSNTMRKYGAYKKECEDWLAANAKKDSVVTLKSGVQYKVLRQGNGPIPADTSKVKVNYKGSLIDGSEFDSSYKRNQPATFTLNQLVKGWTEAMTHMPVGSKWEVYIPQQLGYGERQAGKIKPFSTLIFEIELLSIEK